MLGSVVVLLALDVLVFFGAFQSRSFRVVVHVAQMALSRFRNR